MSCSRIGSSSLGLLLGFLLPTLPVVAQDQPASTQNPSDQASAPAESAEVAVWIDDLPAVNCAEIERLVRTAADPERLAPELKEAMYRQARTQLLGRRLILAGLQREGHLPSEADIDLDVTDLRRRLEVQGIDWQTHLHELGVDEATFRESIRWKLGWSAELQRRLTTENLERFFADRRRDFDGTELEVSQIVLTIPATATDAQWSEAEERLTEVRRRIIAEEIDFATAARDVSAGETAAEGGGLGAIERQGAMPEAFHAAAFALQVGEISPVVRTGIGLHLIRCDAERPGTISFEEAEPRVRVAAMRFLFDRLVEQETPRHRIRFAE